MADTRRDGELPDLCGDGHVLVITRYYHHPAVAMAVIMRNLLSRFKPESFTLMTDPVPETKPRYPGTHDYHFAPRPSFWPKRLFRLWQRVQIPFAVSRAKRLIKKLNVTVIVVCHVDMQAVTVAREAAKATKIPWIPYIHNMIWENYRGTIDEKQAIKVQKHMFAEASSIMVMCDGIADLYKERYGIVSKTLVHNHIEPVRDTLPDAPAEKQCLLAGDIYRINARAAKRVLDATAQLGLPLVLTALEARLKAWGIVGDNARREFYPERDDYLAALERQGVLVTVLDWPDESEQSEEELLTLLPTRVVEYLASGRPVLAHCPEESFMAKFLREHNCAMVVSERSIDALVDAINHLLDGGEDVEKMCRAGLDTVKNVFGIDKVAEVFQDEVNAAAKLKWREKLH